MAKYPAKDVASWLGNSVPIAMKYYAMASAESFQRASAVDGGHIGGHIMSDSPVITSHSMEGQKQQNPVKNGVLIAADEYSQDVKVGRAGLEPAT